MAINEKRESALRKKEGKKMLAKKEKEERRRKKLGLKVVNKVVFQKDLDREYEENLANKNKKKPVKKNSNDFAMATPEETAPIVDEVVATEEVVEELVVEETNEEIEEELVAEETSEDKAKKSRKKAPANREKVEGEESEEKKGRTRNYHIVLRQDGKWQVKREKGAKAIKLFDTQAEAIAFAKARAEQFGVDFVIHKKDGKIRRQTYTKKTEDTQN